MVKPHVQITKIPFIFPNPNPNKAVECRFYTQQLISSAQTHNLGSEIRMVAVEKDSQLPLCERPMKSRMRFSKTHLEDSQAVREPPPQSWFTQISLTRGFTITHLGGCEVSCEVALHPGNGCKL